MVFPCPMDVVEGDPVPCASWEDAICPQRGICIIPCTRRKAADTLNTHDPDCAECFGIETCIFMGNPGRYIIDHGYDRQVTSEERIAKFKVNVEKVMVHEMIWTKTREIMCQRCLCVCGVMGAYHACGCESEIMGYCSRTTSSTTPTSAFSAAHTSTAAQWAPPPSATAAIE